MKKVLIAAVVIVIIVGAWLFDQANKVPAQATVTQQPQSQPIRGADDMRSLKIP